MGHLKVTRTEAEALVRPYVFRVGQYAAVKHIDAMVLLGEFGLESLLRDRVRCLGPVNSTLYPWNVADGLQLQGAEKEASQ